MSAQRAAHVHLNGSVNLDSSQEVFETVGAILGRYIQRVPDGEPGVAKPLFISDQGLERCGVFGKARQAIGDDPGIHDLARMRV